MVFGFKPVKPDCISPAVKGYSMHIPPKLLSSSFAAAVCYLLLLLMEDVLGINKKQRWILAIVFGILFYNFGEKIMQFIRTIFSSIGL